MTAKFENYSKLVPNEQKFDGTLNDIPIRAMKLYGCSFQATSCLTQAETDGNATVTHSLVSIITSKPYDGKHNNDSCIIFTILFMVNHCIFITPV